MKYSVFEVNRLSHFHHVILPDIFAQLLEIPSFEEAGIVCIGAVDKKQAAGAVVIGFQEDGLVSVLSIYVRSDMRNQGIGSELISRVMEQAAVFYSTEIGQLRIGIEMEYTVRLEDKKRFLHFLEKNHFGFHDEQGQIYVIPVDLCEKHLHFDTSNVVSLQKFSRDSRENMGSLLTQFGFNADPEYCFISGNPEAPECLLIAEFGSGQEFYIASAFIGEEKSNKISFLALLTKAVSEMKQKYPECVLIADDSKNPCPEIWKKLAGDEGDVYAHGTAGLLISF